MSSLFSAVKAKIVKIYRWQFTAKLNICIHFQQLMIRIKSTHIFIFITLKIRRFINIVWRCGWQEIKLFQDKIIISLYELNAGPKCAIELSFTFATSDILCGNKKKKLNNSKGNISGIINLILHVLQEIIWTDREVMKGSNWIWAEQRGKAGLQT